LVSGGNFAPNGVINTPVGDQTIVLGDSVDFTGSASDPDGTPPGVTYLWSFGAGSGIPDATVEDPGLQQFDTEGVFQVTFTVTDGEGVADPTPATVTITVTQKPLTLTPTTATVAVGNTQQFTAGGGDGNYTYTIFVNNSGGSINAVGLYTAGGTAGVSDTVRVTDDLGLTANATVSVPPALTLMPTGVLMTPLGAKFPPLTNVSSTASAITKFDAAFVSTTSSVPTSTVKVPNKLNWPPFTRWSTGTTPRTFPLLPIVYVASGARLLLAVHLAATSYCPVRLTSNVHVAVLLPSPASAN